MFQNESSLFPPMGWNSYDYYDTTVTEQDIKKNADYMAKYLKSFGWNYIIVDIQWYAHNPGSRRNDFQYIPFSTLTMDDLSRLLPDPVRFPSSKNGCGFRPLADYVHNLGLKFGIHIMRGIPRIAAHLHTKTISSSADEIADPSSICKWNPDMYGVRNTPEGQAYYDSLIDLYESWGVDFIKCDDICNTNLYINNPFSGKHEIEMLSSAIKRTNRPIILSLSPGPALIEHAWFYKKHANMWRITDDFWDNWELLKNMFQYCELWQDHIETGCYPDCDMLPLGVIGKGFCQERWTRFTHDEQRTMMTLWCIVHSPLILGAELTKLDSWTYSLITNQRVLDLLSTNFKARQIQRTDSLAVWTSVGMGKFFIALFNLSDQDSCISINISDLFSEFSSDNIIAHNLWTNESFSCPNKILKDSLSAHACSLFELK